MSTKQLYRPTLSDIKDQIRSGPNQGVRIFDFAENWNSQYPKEYDGNVPLLDTEEIVNLQGVAVPFSYYEKHLVAFAEDELTITFDRELRYVCLDCGKKPCFMSSDDAQLIFLQVDNELKKMTMADFHREATKDERYETLTKKDCQKLRYMCYQMFHRQLYGIGTTGKRIELPECVYKDIRAYYPDPENKYVGFKRGWKDVEKPKDRRVRKRSSCGTVATEDSSDSSDEE